MEPKVSPEALPSASEPPSSPKPPPQTTWGRLWGAAEQLAQQMDYINEILEESTEALASDALGEALFKFEVLDSRLKEEFDRFAERFDSTPGFRAVQEELWAAPEPRRVKKKPPPPPPKKRGRPRKNPVGAGGGDL